MSAYRSVHTELPSRAVAEIRGRLKGGGVMCQKHLLKGTGPKTRLITKHVLFPDHLPVNRYEMGMQVRGPWKYRECT